MLFLYFLVATASVEALSLSSRATTGPVWGGINITQMVLQVAGAISSPTCNATGNCTQLSNTEISSCLSVAGDPGCWCSTTNLDGVHYCAICMSNPTDNTTTPEQTATATQGHISYHVGCNAYQAFLNGTASSNGTSTSSSAMSSSSSFSSASTTPTQMAGTASGPKPVSAGAISGAVVGGVVALALIAAAVCLLYRGMQYRHERLVGSMRGTSAFSSEAKHPFGTGDNSPATGYSPPPNINPNPNIHQGIAPYYDTRMLNIRPEV